MADGVYHVFSHSHPSLVLFQDDPERRRFLTLVEREVAAREWRCWGYCLMDTHYHLVVKTPRADLDRGMQRIGSDYAQWVNRRRARSSHVFSSRYGSRLITREGHLLEVLRYVPLNPVRAGLCRDAGAWPWSSHRVVAGLERGRTFVDVDGVHSLVEGWSGRPGAVGYLSLLAGARGAAGCDGTGAGIALAHRRDGRPMRDIADELGVSVSTVHRRLRRFDGGVTVPEGA